MPTYYISALTGDNANNGTDPDFPKATLGGVNGALISASSDRDFIEFLDEETYTETSQLQFQANDITIQHTASALGRPVIDASSLGSSQLFDARGRTGIRLDGLEIKGSGDSGQELYRNNLTSDGAGYRLTNCFIYNFAALSDGFLAGTSPSPIILDQTAFMFCPSGVDAIKFNTNSYVEIKNCFLSRSGGASDQPIVRSLSGPNLNATASFSTFIYNDCGVATVVIEGFGKAINNIVSGSGTGGGSGLDGIDASDHTYNLVSVPDASFKNGSGGASSPGTGDIERRPTFIDGTSRGNTYTVVENYALAEGSYGIDQGIEYDGIVVDIIGTTRPQGGSYDIGAFEFISQDPTWTDGDGTQTYPTKFGSSFQIYRTANTLVTRTFAYGTENRQAPFYVSIAGPATIRERSGSYKAET